MSVDPDFLAELLTGRQLEIIGRVLKASGKGEDLLIEGILGRRRLTTDERERLRLLLASELLSLGSEEDASPTAEGREIDAIIGRLMYY